ncbi:MAG: phytoene/squalene synthase family protein [Candidatus Dormibacteraceae bacterium]
MSEVSKSFSTATQLLPSKTRSDVQLLYLVVRRLDDLVDKRSSEAADRLQAALAWAEQGAVGSPEAEILEYLARRYSQLPRAAVIDFCSGQLQDLSGIHFSTEADLNIYCYQVAGTVGRLMACLLGANSPEADLAARSLGIAMQRTNILRDIDEDLAVGRCYLPTATLELAEIRDLASNDRSLLLRIERSIAEWWYAEGLKGLVNLPQGRSRWAIRSAAYIYRDILAQIERDGWGARRPLRSRLSGWRRLIWVLRAGLA